MIRETVQQLLHLLTRWDRRLRLQQSLVWVPRGAMAGLGLGIGLAVASRLYPWLLPEELLRMTVIAVMMGVLLVLVAIWLGRRDALTMARHFDRAFGLKERVSTALELAAGRARSPNAEITARQLEDTLQRAVRIQARAYLPLRLVPRDLGILLALAAVLALLLLLENPQNTVLAEQQALQAAIQDQTSRLEDLREEILNNPALDDATRRDMLEALDEAIETLSQEELSREEAVATLSRLGQEMSEIAQRPLEAAQQQALERAAERLSEQAGEVAEAMQSGDLEEAAGALDRLSTQVGEMTEAQQQDLAQALQSAAEALAETNPELAQSLQEAAEALEEGDSQGAREALEQAAGQLSEQAGEVARSPNDAGQQLAAQAGQQVQQSIQQIAQSGTGSTSTGQIAGNPQGDTAAPLGESGQGGAQNQMGQAGQSGEGDQSQQSAEGFGGGNEGGEGGTEPVAGAAGGAGDAPGPAVEGGFAATGEQISQGNNPDGEGLTEYEPVYAPQRIGEGEGAEMQIAGSGEPGDVVTQEGNLAEGPEGESLVGYDEVFSDYANAANQALEQEYIPLNLRDVVHDYFSSLEPSR